MATITSMDQLFRDMYPLPGTRLKQWVVDSRRERAWEVQTCPRVVVPVHDDNTGLECRNARSTVAWTDLNHDCCGECNELMEATESRDDVSAWLAEKAKRPPIEQDRTKLSDEVEPEREHPTYTWLKR
jgi:hypothetical protein